MHSLPIGNGDPAEYQAAVSFMSNNSDNRGRYIAPPSIFDGATDTESLVPMTVAVNGVEFPSFEDDDF